MEYGQQAMPAQISSSQSGGQPAHNPVSTSRIDRTAMGFSILCLAHCLAIPLLATIGPLVLPHNQNIHWILLMIALPLTTFGLWKGVAIHRDIRILILGIIGLSTMAFGALELYGEQVASYTTIVGVCMIFCAHALNIWKQRLSSGSEV